MSFSVLRLAAKGSGHYFRRYALLYLGTLTAAALVSGSLLTGYSVRRSLGTINAERLGKAGSYLSAGGGSFTAGLADRMECDGVPVLQVTGTVAKAGGSLSVPGIKVYGVPPEFWKLALEPFPARLQGGGVFTNKTLAGRLKITSGDSLVVTLPDAFSLNTDFVLSTAATRGHPAVVGRVLGDTEFGRFGLGISQIDQPVLFADLDWLGKALGIPGRANLVLFPADCEKETGELLAEAYAAASLDDAGLKLRPAGDTGYLLLEADDLFLSASEAAAALRAFPYSASVLTYFVNSAASEKGMTPYSFIAGIGDTDLIPMDPPGPGEIVLSRWMADDLQAGPGDVVAIEYFRVERAAGLIREFRDLRVASIFDDPAGISFLTPDYPGLAGTANCSDWDPVLPLDLDRVRPADEEYWDRFGGAPKAVVNYDDALNMWGGRFGEATAVIIDAKGKNVEETGRILLASLNGAELGWQAVPAAELSREASRRSINFGELFLGFSLVIIAAALYLTGLLHANFTERRRIETDLLIMIGFPKRLAGMVFTAEAVFPALIASAAGSLCGYGITHFFLAVMRGLWGGLLGTGSFTVYADPLLMIASAACFWLYSTGFAFFAWRGTGRRKKKIRVRSSRTGITIRLLLLAAAGVPAVFLTAGFGEIGDAAVRFFSAGFCFLGVLVLGSDLLIRCTRAAPPVSLRKLGSLFLRRGSGRSTGIMLLTAAGVFCVVSVQLFNKDSAAAAQAAGTGGWSYFIESSFPVSDPDRLIGDLFPGAEFVPLRTVDGDDASCLNLNMVFRPRLLGIDPERTGGGFAFAGPEAGKGWQVLDERYEDGSIPAVIDEAVLTWGLGLKAGDTIEYTDGIGGTFFVRIAGILRNSVFQGSLLVSEQNLLKRFGGIEGYRFFLAGRSCYKYTGGPDNFDDLGLFVETTRQRLDSYNRIENGYIAIFTILSGLGILLALGGTGVLLARSVQDSDREIALLQAVGFGRSRIGFVFLWEYGTLIVTGVILGFAASTASVLPIRKIVGDVIPLHLAVVWPAVLALFGIGVVAGSIPLLFGNSFLSRLKNL